MSSMSSTAHCSKTQCFNEPLFRVIRIKYIVQEAINCVAFKSINPKNITQKPVKKLLTHFFNNSVIAILFKRFRSRHTITRCNKFLKFSKEFFRQNIPNRFCKITCNRRKCPSHCFCIVIKY